MEWVRALVLERIALHAVDAEESDSSLLEVGAESADHALAFLLMSSPMLVGKARMGMP